MEALPFLIRLQKEYESHLITCVDSDLVFTIELGFSVHPLKMQLLTQRTES